MKISAKLIYSLSLKPNMRRYWYSSARAVIKSTALRVNSMVLLNEEECTSRNQFH